jgi:hypothetical protein
VARAVQQRDFSTFCYTRIRIPPTNPILAPKLQALLLVLVVANSTPPSQSRGRISFLVSTIVFAVVWQSKASYHHG